MALCDRFHRLPREILDEDVAETMRYAAIVAYAQQEI